MFEKPLWNKAFTTNTLGKLPLGKVPNIPEFTSGH